VSEQLRPQERGAETNHEIQRAAHERLRQLSPSAERENNRQDATESAREKIRKVEQVRPAAEAAKDHEPAHRGILTKAVNYRHTMISLRHQMKPTARAFSSFIHAPAVEAASDFAGKTVLRPSVTLGATTTAMLLVGFFYFYARYYGFGLHGSEFWITLIVGGIIGLIVEVLGKALRHR
jgi:hypothetical protein